jgi:hypothetical protein
MRSQNYSSALKSAPVTAGPENVSALEIYIDDEWLEALLENLALVNLSRTQCAALIGDLEQVEGFQPRAARHTPEVFPSVAAAPTGAHRPLTHKVVVGARFDSEFNDYQMRAPVAMSGDNVRDTIERAIRQLQSGGHVAAVRQIVFFLATNMEEVLADSDDE